MSTATPTMRPRSEPTGHEAVLLQRLARVRRLIRSVALFRGGSWLLTAVLLTLILAGLLDYAVRLPDVVRGFVLVGMLAGGGVILAHFTLRPLREPTDDLSLALRVEDRYPILNDSLASTIEFLHREAIPGESVPMRRELVRRTMNKAHDLNFNSVVQTKGLRTAGAMAVLALVVAVGLVCISPLKAGTAVARIFSPFSAVEWPRKTKLTLGEITRRIGKGRDYRLKGTIDGVMVSKVSVEISDERTNRSRDKTFNVDATTGEFLLHLRPDEVQSNFSFRITANDADSGYIDVEVLELPMLVPFGGKPSPQVTLEPPGYTDLPAVQHLPPGTGVVDLVAGTKVTYRAAANRPLKRAWARLYPTPAEAIASLGALPIGRTSALEVLACVRAVEWVVQPVPAEFEGDRKRFTITFRPAVAGEYVVHFEDENELTNHRPYSLRLRNDPAPMVRLTRPVKSQGVLQALPTAELPVTFAVEDPEFAVKSAWLEYRTRQADAAETGGEEQGRRISMYHAAAGLSQAMAPLAGSAVRAAPVGRLRLPRLEFDFRLGLRGLRHPDGTALVDGDVVYLRALADDFNDYMSPGPGKSVEIEIHIISRDKLAADVARKQEEIEKRILEAREHQREALKGMKDIDARLRKGGNLSPEREAAEAEQKAEDLRREALAEDEKAQNAKTRDDKFKHRQKSEDLQAKAKEQQDKADELKRQANQLSDVEKEQKKVRELIGNEDTGLRAEVKALRETLKQNGLENTNAMDRARQVQSELDRLAERELDQIEPKLSEARTLAAKQAELQDEKARKERQAALENQAKDAERDAATAEKEAKALKDRAQEEEERAQKETDPAKQANEKKEAARLAKEAEARAKRAQELRAEADQARREAAEKPDPAKPRQPLAEAQKRQEEVEKSLNALVRDMESKAGTRELQNEAGRILQEQRAQEKDLADLAEKGLMGKSLDELTPEQRAELENQQEAQKRLQDRTAQLLDKMRQAAEERATKDKDTAKELRDAAERAEQDNITGQMKGAADSLKNNQLNDARRRQRDAIKGLENLKKNLDNQNEARLDRLIQKLREAQQKVEKLMDEQEGLQKKIREAGQIKDPGKRDNELMRLAQKQKELEKKNREIQDELARLNNERAKQSLKQAGQEMGDAGKQLERGEQDNEKQDDVLDRLEETRRELEQAKKKAEEELGREQMERMANLIRGIKGRQESLGGESKRIQNEALLQKEWVRRLKPSLRDLGTNQQELGKETGILAKEKLTRVPVFSKLMEQAGRDMERAGRRFEDMYRNPPDLKLLPDEDSARLQASALKRLDRLLDSLKEAQEKPQPLAGGGEGGGGGGDGGGGGGGDDSLPSPAQLRLLRTMQKEVNDRTEAFNKRHPDTSKLNARELRELQEIRLEQKEVADLLERLSNAGGEPENPAEPGGDEAMGKAEKKGEK